MDINFKLLHKTFCKYFVLNSIPKKKVTLNHNKKWGENNHNSYKGQH